MTTKTTEDLQNQRGGEAVQANPGETIKVIASQVGETPRVLDSPMHRLKHEGRLRTAGRRHLTRYLPMPASKAA